jgi:hypothetical protein
MQTAVVRTTLCGRLAHRRQGHQVEEFNVAARSSMSTSYLKLDTHTQANAVRTLGDEHGPR